MEESISKFVTAIISVFLLFIFPVYSAYEKKDDISYALAVRFTQEFVDNVRRKGYITQELYNDYRLSLASTGNTYSVELEHEYVRYDGDYVDKTIGSATRNTEFFDTAHILNVLNQGEVYAMNVNDNFNVKIKNTNVTLATVIYNIVTVNMSSSNVRVHVDYGGKILSEKWYEANLKYSQYGGITENNPYNIDLTASDIDFDKIVNDDEPGGIVDGGGDTGFGDGIIDSTPQEEIILANYVKIGDYVSYEPNGSTSTKLGSETLYRASNIKWRVLSVDRANKKVTLISTGNALTSTVDISLTSTSTTTLNNVCYTLFSNSYLGDARNVTRSDLIKLANNASSTLVEELQYVGRLYPLANTVEKYLTKVSGNNISLSIYDVIDFTGKKNESGVEINTNQIGGVINLGGQVTAPEISIVNNTYGSNMILRPVINIKENIQIHNDSCQDESNPCGTSRNPWQLVTTVATQTIYEVADIGDYIDYTPTQNANAYVATSTETGYKNNQSFSQNEEIKWQVLDKVNGKVILISTTNVVDKIYLEGYAAYNNSVDIIHNICKALYSRTGVASARSITVEDIEKYCGLNRNIPNMTWELGRLGSERYPARLNRSDYMPNNYSAVSKWESNALGNYYFGTIPTGDNKKLIAVCNTDEVVATNQTLSDSRQSGIINSLEDPYLLPAIGINYQPYKRGPIISTIENIQYYVMWYNGEKLLYGTCLSVFYENGKNDDKSSSVSGGIRAIVELDGDNLVNPASGNGSTSSTAIRLIY